MVWGVARRISLRGVLRLGEVLQVGFDPGQALPKKVLHVLPKFADVVFEVLLQIPVHAPKRNNVGNTNPEDR